MGVELFLTLLANLSIVSSGVTEALKKLLGDRQYSTNLLVLIVSVVVGWGGGALEFVLMNIPFTEANIISLLLLGPAVWLSAMEGYDKVKQLTKQVSESKIPIDNVFDVVDRDDEKGEEE